MPSGWFSRDRFSSTVCASRVSMMPSVGRGNLVAVMRLWNGRYGTVYGFFLPLFRRGEWTQSQLRFRKGIISKSDALWAIELDSVRKQRKWCLRNHPPLNHGGIFATRRFLAKSHCFELLQWMLFSQSTIVRVTSSVVEAKLSRKRKPENIEQFTQI